MGLVVQVPDRGIYVPTINLAATSIGQRLDVGQLAGQSCGLWADVALNCRVKGNPKGEGGKIDNLC